MLPLLLRRCGLDPATSSAPFVATLVDVTGLMIYFTPPADPARDGAVMNAERLSGRTLELVYAPALHALPARQPHVHPHGEDEHGAAGDEFLLGLDGEQRHAIEQAGHDQRAEEHAEHACRARLSG